MTHDELLGKLNPALTVNNITKQYEAIKSVLSLHKPREDAATTCAGCALDILYPCPTIQAIEKELG